MINAYQVGINLVVTNNVGAAVGQINQGLSGLQRQMQSLNSLFNGHQVKRWGETVLGGLHQMVEAGKDLNTEFTRSLMLGGEIAKQAGKIKADSIAGSMNLPGWTPSQLDKLTTEMGTQVGLDEAGKMQTTLAMLGTVLSSHGKDGGPSALLDAYKTVEAVGGAYKDDGHGGKEFSQERFERYMNALQASILAAGGLFGTRDALQAARQGGPSLRGMEPEVLFPFLSEAAVQMGASRAGTANMSWARQFAGGIMTQRAARSMESVGLLHHGEWETVRGGGVKVHDDARHRLASALKDPPAWVRDTLMPIMKGKDNTDVMSIMMSLFGQQTTARLVSDLEQNNPQFFRMRNNAANVPSIQQNFETLNSQSVEQGMTNLATAWKGLQEVITDAAAPALISGMHGLTDAIHYVTTEVAAHPQAATYVTEFGVALGGLLVVTGSLRMLQFAIGARAFATTMQVLLGLTGLPAMVGTLGAIWNGLAFLCGITGLTAAAGGLTALATAIGTIVGAIKGFSMSPEDSKKAMDKLETLGHQRLPTAPSNMVPQDQGPGVNPITGEPTAYHTSMPARRAINVNLTGSVPIQADGRTIAHVVGEKLAAVMTSAPRGSYAPDPSISPQWGAQLA